MPPGILFRTAWRRINRAFATWIGTNREGTQSANRKLALAPVSGVGMHQHKCSLCGTIWQHGEEWDRDMLAHECRVCGSHQFRVFKADGGQTAASPEQTHDKLVAAFASADPFVRSTTLFALNVGDQAARGVLPNLATMATADPETMVRLAAVEALRRFGADAVAAIPALSQALADRHPEVRRAAALTLGDLGTAALGALTALTDRLSDNHPRVRTVVAAALEKIRFVSPR